MTAEGGSAPPDPADDVAATPEAPLPLRDLDAALAPVRRVVVYALQPGARPRYVEANARRHLQLALALDLPMALRDDLATVVGQLEGFDAAGPDEQRERLSRAYASLTRLDAVAGLPLPRPRLRPVRKPVQRDRPEPAPRPPPQEEEGPEGAVQTAPDETRGEQPEEWSPRPAAAPESGPKRFRGDLGMALADLVPELAEALDQQGLQSVGDLLLQAPQDHEVIEPVHGAGQDVPAGRVAVSGRLGSGWTVLEPGGGAQRWSRIVGAGPMRVRWADGIEVPWRAGDQRVVLIGQVSEEGVIDDAEPARADGHQARLASYGLESVDDRVVRGLIAQLEGGLGRVRDPVSSEALQALRLPSLGAALASAHLLGDVAARRRLAFDEALLVQLGGALTRVRRGKERGLSHAVLHGFAGKVEHILDIGLDDSQQRCLEDIKRDLRRSSPMRRVITGEVGAGKGKIALLAAAMVAEGRAQVLMLSPDEAAAQERFLHSEPVLREGGIVARLVPSPPTHAQRDAIRRGEVHVVFGTLDLLEQEIEFRRLGLVVASERERWGRVSALHAALAAPRPDLLVLTSVPVGPRILMTAYADHDVAVHQDPERRPARISVCRAGDRDRAYASLREVVARGEQGIVLFPMVRGQDALDTREALRVVRALEADALSGLEVGLFHGAMPAEERRRVYEDFLHRRLQVLVATTRIEDGPTLPGATAVVIEQADSVDQWRLHRVVGFFSRSRSRAEALLVVGELADSEAEERVQRVLSAPNGFSLTEALVELQGVQAVVEPGAAPLPAFGWLDLDTDLDLVLSAREEVQRMLKADPAMRRGSHADLMRELSRRWADLWPDVDAEQWPPPSVEEGDPQGGASSNKRRRRRRRRR